MDKKDIVISILEKLKLDRSLALGLLSLIRDHPDMDDVVDGLYAIMQETIVKTTDTQLKTKLQQSVEVLSRIKYHSDKYHKREQEDAEKLLDGLV